jgi:hypothetical protein
MPHGKWVFVKLFGAHMGFEEVHTVYYFIVLAFQMHLKYILNKWIEHMQPEAKTFYSDTICFLAHSYIYVNPSHNFWKGKLLKTVQTGASFCPCM